MYYRTFTTHANLFVSAKVEGSSYINHFLQPDSLIPDPSNPQAWNRFSYVTNNPLRYSDPTGHRNCEEDGYNCPGDDKLSIAVGRFKGWWTGERVGYKGSGGYLGHGPRQWILNNLFSNNFVFGPREAILYSLLQDDSVTLLEGPSKIERFGLGEGIGAVKKDQRFLDYQNNLISSAIRNPKYGKTPFSFNDIDTVKLGGNRGTFAPWDTATWKVAGNELTWILRDTDIAANVDVSQSGSIRITYTFSDVLDLRPQEGRLDKYNNTVTVLGFIYHDMLGSNDKMPVNGAWIYDYIP